MAEEKKVKVESSEGTKLVDADAIKKLFQDELPDMIRVVTQKELDKALANKEIGKAKAPVEMNKTKEESATKFRSLVDSILDRDYVKAKELSEGTDSKGGYLVPEEFLAQVLDIAGQYGIARQRGRVLTMTKDTLKVPKIDSKPDVSWISEGESITATDAEFGLVTLTAKKGAILVPMTSELLEDSAVDVQGILADMFAEQFAGGEDNQAFNGDGTVFTGILEVSGTNAVTMGTGDTSFEDISASDLINIIAAVPSTVAGRSVFVMNRAIWAVIKSITDGSGNYLFSPNDNTIWGYPIVLSDKMPDLSDDSNDTPFLIFGDLNYLWLGDRRKMAMALADQATIGSTNLFQQDMMALRVTERVAEVVVMPNAFAIMKTAAS